MSCTCGHIVIGLEVTALRSWSELCPEHGVGTQYFRELPVMPFGYADERHTTREEWLAFLQDDGT